MNASRPRQRNWYVFARNMAKNRVATFAISRFRSIEPTGSSFTLPVDFDPRTYANNACGITGGEKPIKVRLLFEPKLAVYITERQWHATNHMQCPGNGCIRPPRSGRCQSTDDWNIVALPEACAGSAGDTALVGSIGWVSDKVRDEVRDN